MILHQLSNWKVKKEIATLDCRRLALVEQEYQRQNISTQIPTTRNLLQRFRDKVADPTWQTKRELVMARAE